MARELITSWGDYQTAIDQLLALASPAVMVQALEQSIHRMKEHGL